MRTIIFLLLAGAVAWAKIGTISAMRGEAAVMRGSEHLSAAIGLAIDEKDVIKTRERSKVQVILEDQTVITVGPKSEFSFESYGYKTQPHAAMRAKSGFFKAVTGKIGKIAPERFSIKTKSATIGIRGTHFMGYIDDTTERIGCLKGEIVVVTNEGTFTVSAGKMLTFKGKRWRIETFDAGLFRGGEITTQSGDRLMRDHSGPGLSESAVEEDTLQEPLKEAEDVPGDVSPDVPQDLPDPYPPSRVD